MTTVSMGGGCWLAVSPKESVASITAFPFSKDGNHPTQIFTSCVSRRALAGNLDLGTAAILKRLPPSFFSEDRKRQPCLFLKETKTSITPTAAAIAAPDHFPML